jgi:hypothetical protein
MKNLLLDVAQTLKINLKKSRWSSFQKSSSQFSDVLEFRFYFLIIMIFISVMRKNTQKKLRVLVLKTLVQMLILAVSLRNKSSE